MKKRRKHNALDTYAYLTRKTVGPVLDRTDREVGGIAGGVIEGLASILRGPAKPQKQKGKDRTR